MRVLLLHKEGGIPVELHETFFEPLQLGLSDCGGRGFVVRVGRMGGETHSWSASPCLP